MKHYRGFTLIEVLLALAIIAIALTALLRATGQATVFTQRVKEKTSCHWVAMHTISAIKLGLIAGNENSPIEQSTTLLGQTWYWKAILSATPIKHMDKITVHVAPTAHSNPLYSLIGYRYSP